MGQAQKFFCIKIHEHKQASLPVLMHGVYTFTVLLASKEAAFMGVLRVEEPLGNRYEEVWTGSRGMGGETPGEEPARGRRRGSKGSQLPSRQRRTGTRSANSISLPHLGGACSCGLPKEEGAKI